LFVFWDQLLIPDTFDPIRGDTSRDPFAHIQPKPGKHSERRPETINITFEPASRVSALPSFVRRQLHLQYAGVTHNAARSTSIRDQAQDSEMLARMQQQLQT
jgi:hypothetical protein